MSLHRSQRPARPRRAGRLVSVLVSRSERQARQRAVDYIEVSKVTGGIAQLYRRAVRYFCKVVDAHLLHTASAASLARAQPDLAAVLAAWERALPAGYRAGSMTPASLASAVRALIARRDAPSTMRGR